MDNRVMRQSEPQPENEEPADLRLRLAEEATPPRPRAPDASPGVLNSNQSTTAIREIALDQLSAHRANANVMPAHLFEKLKRHLSRTGRYPPVIVRPLGDGFEILDGHHRVKALRELGATHARCVVWEVDDAEALLLLSTLNRLQGRDDASRRASLLEELSRLRDGAVEELASLVPEDAAGLRHLVEEVAKPATLLRDPRPLDALPVAVHFFLTREQRRRLEARLREIGGPRETALMSLVGACST